jgi:hypothetical protein
MRLRLILAAGIATLALGACTPAQVIRLRGAIAPSTQTCTEHKVCAVDKSDTMRLPDGSILTTDPYHAAELEQQGAHLISANRPM